MAREHVGSRATREMVAWALDLPVSTSSGFGQEAGPDWSHRLADAINRYLDGEPLSYVLGHREFYGRTFLSDRRAMAVRPYCEVVVEAVVADCRGRKVNVIEVGCGAAAMIVTLALELDGWFVGTDVAESALALARENVARLNADVSLIASDLFARVRGRFDVVVANLPWRERAGGGADTEWDPPSATFDESGQAFGIIRRFLEEVGSHLRPGGSVYLFTPGEVQASFGGVPISSRGGDVIAHKMSADEAIKAGLWLANQPRLRSV